MVIEIMVERDSSHADLNKAYQALAFGYRTTVFDYLREHKIQSVSDLASKAGCRYPDIIGRFIKDGSVSPTGKDLDDLISAVDGKGRWLNAVRHVQIHASVMYSQPAEYSDQPLSSEVLPKETDLAIRESLTKMSWFYLYAAMRFMEENPGL